MNGDNGISMKLWSGLVLLMGAMLLIAVILIFLISVGVFDPRPVGELIKTLSLDGRHTAGESGFTSWLTEEQPAEDYSIKLKASFVSGEPDAAYGLVLGSPDTESIFAVSPLGYLSVWTQVIETDGSVREEIYVPWGTWPHVRTGTETNEIWLDIEDDQAVRIRINQELLSSTPIPVFGSDIGLWSISYGQESVIDFKKLEIFSSSE